jgi:hypothetical protein
MVVIVFLDGDADAFLAVDVVGADLSSFDLDVHHNCFREGWALVSSGVDEPREWYYLGGQEASEFFGTGER